MRPSKPGGQTHQHPPLLQVNLQNHAFQGRDEYLTVFCILNDVDVIGTGFYDLHDLPESGFGIFIIRSFMNEVRYEPKIDGRTNVLRMIKYLNAQTHPVRTDPAQGTFDDA